MARTTQASSSSRQRLPHRAAVASAASVASVPATAPTEVSMSLGSPLGLPEGVAALAQAAGNSGLARAASLPSAGAPARLSPRTGRVAARHNRAGTGADGRQGDRPIYELVPAAGQTSVIQHFVNVVPEAVWLILAVALSVAGTAGSVALRTSRRARRQAGEFAAVAAAAHTDSLTDALNRRGFSEAVERELARARRYDSPFVLAYFDVRGLKRLNDSAGHHAGDRLLREVAALLKDSAREADVVGRIGGDEFALLLTEQPADTAAAVSKRIRARVAERREVLNLDIPWDLTIGTAAYPEDGDSFDELLATADRRLYQQRGIELAVR
jgi:diguanylate cyclase (GGDEF)-like protein